MRTLLALRFQRARHRLKRQAGNLAVFFDPWSVVHYLFAGLAFGPGLYLYWANPPALPALGLTLLSLWPLLGVVLGWGWALSQGIFGAAAGVPLPFSRADVHLLLTSPVSRRLVVLERFVTGWWRRASGPVGLVLLFAALTAGYHAVAWSQVFYLAVTLVFHALGTLGLSVAIFVLGPKVRWWLGAVRQGGQVLFLLLSVGAFFFGVGRQQAPVPGALPTVAISLSGAIWPALLFAVLAAGLGWLLAGRQDLALWAGLEDETFAPRGKKRAPLPGFARGYGAFRWKHRAALVKRPLWQWISRFGLPVLGALIIGPLGSRLGGAVGAVMAALALLQGARFLAGPVGEEYRTLSRLGRLPATVREFLSGTLLEISLWLLLPCTAAWALWGAGWLAVLGGPGTALILAVLALQNEWAGFMASLTVGKLAGDASFAYIALSGVVLAGHYLMGLGSPLAMLALTLAGALLGGFLVLLRLYGDLLLWRAG